ncbi:MAG TPA: STAS domain-containing protein [Gaiellales bacterium]|jgi:anti-anti-sigma factor|nr:STAS domain-containing protein [Gaiellales bacterium]
MATALEVDVRVDGGEATFALAGDIDGGARGGLDTAYAEATAQGAGSLRLDFGRVSYINSTGIALIVGLLGRARADRIPVSARGLSDHYREIFEITRLSDFMTIDNEGASDE